MGLKTFRLRKKVREEMSLTVNYLKTWQRMEMYLDD